MPATEVREAFDRNKDLDPVTARVYAEHFDTCTKPCIARQGLVQTAPQRAANMYNAGLHEKCLKGVDGVLCPYGTPPVLVALRRIAPPMTTSAPSSV